MDILPLMKIHQAVVLAQLLLYLRGGGGLNHEVRLLVVLKGVRNGLGAQGFRKSQGSFLAVSEGGSL